MIYAGIDPGKDGAIAVLDADGGVISVDPIPLLVPSDGRAVFDLPAIRDLLRDLRTREVFVTLEQLHALPSGVKGGSLANFGRGEAQGWLWMLVALEIPFHAVVPRVWQRIMCAGIAGRDPKFRAILAAQRLFPRVRLTRTERSRKPHDGFADALLLAEYGRRGRGLPQNQTTDSPQDAALAAVVPRRTTNGIPDEW